MNTHRFLNWVLVLCLLLPALPVQAQDTPFTPTQTQASISVNSLGDEGDADTGDGICDTTGRRSPPAPYSGVCTLRAAIQTANATPATDTINFLVPGVIQPVSIGLTPLYYPAIIDGNREITLDGSLLPAGTRYAGLSLFQNAGGSTIQGLTIRNFSGWGILVGDRVGGSTIQNNTIRANGMGVQIGRDSPANTVARNVIVLNSGLTGDGINVSSNGNVIKGNKIGTNGFEDQGNAGHGIIIYGSNNLVGAATGISVGGSCTGDCNLIAGNGGDGIAIAQGDPAGGVNNIVRGNFIGTNLAGTEAIPNDSDGVSTNGAYNSIIGNLISGNGSASAFDGAHGVYLEAGAIGNIVRGNLIGAKSDGVTPLGNYDAGINLNSAGQNVIGADAVTAAEVGVSAVPTTCAGDCNVILGNRAGISITQAVDPGLNKIIGNFIGVAANGLAAPGNLGNGIYMQGLTITVASNVIAGNGGNGIEIRGVAYLTPLPINQHVVQGNYIGVLPDGVTQAGNARHGILVNRSADNWIGGTQSGQGNIIAYNGNYANSIYDGVVITGTNAVGNRILRNSIFENGWTLSGQGLDLGDDGPTPNDATDADTGPNNLQNYPVITRIQGATVTGVLTSTANTTFRLEFFGSPTCTQIGYGQGKDFLGSFDVTTNANGRADFQQALATAPAGRIVTATATDPNGNTSEFSPCYGGMIVNSVGDDADATPDGVCNTGKTNLTGDPECTLRAALMEANRQPDPNTIIFDIPGFSTASVNETRVIFLDSPLPPVLFPVVIDGRTQPGGYVVIDGFHLGNNTSGLVLRGGASQVRGLSIISFKGYGIELREKGGNIIAGNFIGLYPDGAPGGNKSGGILVASTDNLIGGKKPAERNVIGANGATAGFGGIHITYPATNTLIVGNLIGVLANGTLRGNEMAGVNIDGSRNNYIGDATTTPVDDCRGACNVIAGNRYGVMINGAAATANKISGNFIGVNQAGTAAAPNLEYGVVVDNAPANDIAHNVIGGNGPAGVQAAALTNGDGVVLKGAGATGNIVSRNKIGIDPTGTWAIGNARHGIWIEQAPANMIADNLISGNGASGVMVHGANAINNKVYGNHIGVDGSGAAALANAANGVTLDGAHDNTVGGAGNDSNLISGNRGDGVQITGGAQRNTVGGNRISGNTGNGVHITGEGAQNNTVAGNTIGLNITT
ncbi:MAG: right-handed parallel beta-helix repeat-containing protein, partial [Anaerolineae bacterium]